MNLVLLTVNIAEELDEFINHWSKLYSYVNEDLYDDSIDKEIFIKEDIQNLYTWKNGMRLSEAKQRSVDIKIKAKLSIINDFKRSTSLDIEGFKKEFKDVTTVWRIFLLHTIKPQEFPIYDQHIHRAFLFINNEDWGNVSNSSIKDKPKEEFYFGRYLPFIEANGFNDLRKVDKAFFAFGQFLRTNYSAIIEKDFRED